MKVTNPQILYALSASFAAALAGVGYVYIDALGSLLLATLAFLSSFFTLSIAWRHRNNIEQLHKFSESIAMFGLILFLPSIVTLGLLPGLLVLLAFAQLALNLQLVEHKHVHYGLLVSFICLFMGAAEAISGYYLFFMSAYAIAAAFCLSYLNSDKRGSGQIPFHPITALHLMGWLLGLTLIIYLVFPRLPAANLGGQYGNSPDIYKESEWPDDSDSGEQESNPDQNDDEGTLSYNQDTFIYQGFDQSFDIEQPSQGQGGSNALLALMSAPHGAYLKVESFDRFDGERWYKSQHGQHRLKLKNFELDLEPAKEINFQQNITILQNLGPYIPVAPVVAKLHFPAESIARDVYHNLKLPRGLQKDTVYTVESIISYHQQRLLSGSKFPPRDQDLNLYDGFNTRITRLAEQVTQGAENNLDKALLLESHLRQHYRYDVESIFTSQQHTPLDYFLFDAKAGHCEFFASALAIMLRSQGIPSRLITGFSATTLNPLTGYYEIHSLDGHAWVEAWIEDKGWLLLEATPPYQLPEPSTNTVTANQVQSYVDQLKKYAELGGDSEPTLAQIWTFIVDQVLTIIQYLKILFQQHLLVLSLIPVILFSGWLLYRHFKNDILAWRLYLKVKTYQHSNMKSDVIFYMQHIHKLLKLKNQPRLPGDSIESLCNHVVLQGIDQPSLQALASQINNRFYENESNNLNGELFKNVFFHIYHQTR